jgi:hypothetical protein
MTAALINALNSIFLKRDPWVTYTPTITQSGAVTITVTYARYMVLANLIVGQGRVQITSAGTGNNPIVIGGIDAAIAPTNVGTAPTYVIGTAVISNTGTAHYQGALYAQAAADWRVQAHNVASPVGVTPNFALASGDFIGWQFAYER